MGRPRGRGGRRGQKRSISQASFGTSATDEELGSPKRKEDRTESIDETFENTEDDGGAVTLDEETESHATLQAPTEAADTLTVDVPADENYHTPPDRSPPPRPRLTDTPGPRADGSFEYFERGIMDETCPLQSSSNMSDPMPPPQFFRVPKVARPIRGSTPISKVTDQTTTVASRPPFADLGQAQAPISPVELIEQDVMMDEFEQEPSAQDELGLSLYNAIENMGFDSAVEAAAATTVGEDVCGQRERLASRSPGPSTSSQMFPPAPPPTPASPAPAVQFSNALVPLTHGQDASVDNDSEQSSDESPQPVLEKIELERIKKACQQMFEHEWGDKRKRSDRRHISPYHWTEFRKSVAADGELRVDGNLLLHLQEVRDGWVLCRASTSKPICTLPSCFSTDGTSRRLNTKCSKHRGNATSYAVMELIFHEEVLGRHIAVGVEHVFMDFSHNHEDPKEELQRKIMDEYSSSGLLEDTAHRLKKCHLKRCARELLDKRTATIRRQWIFSNLKLACRHFFIIALAAKMVNKCLGIGVIPRGEFKGKHLEVVTRNFYLEGEVSKRTEEEIFEEVDREQFGTYRMCIPVDSLIFDWDHHLE